MATENFSLNFEDIRVKYEKTSDDSFDFKATGQTGVQTHINDWLISSVSTGGSEDQASSEVVREAGLQSDGELVQAAVEPGADDFLF